MAEILVLSILEFIADRSNDMHLANLIAGTCFLASNLTQVVAQQYRPIGSCEGCEAILEASFPDIRTCDTLPGFQNSSSSITIHGTITDLDGQPVEGVVLYIYHTDRHGRYTPTPEATGWARRHGAIRGWIKTDDKGHYEFVTNRPGVYPDRTEPAHIHATILEPNGSYYWIDSFHFADDPLLEPQNPDSQPRGGSGVVHLETRDGTQTGLRHIQLGLNVPGYR